MKKQTAVEWLQSEIDNKDIGEIPMWIYEFIEQAKAMEREQTVEAYLEGVQTIHHEDYLPVHPIFKEDDKCSKNGVKKEGESCTLNDNCIYPKCLE
jgi:hypothetical protein